MKALIRKVLDAKPPTYSKSLILNLLGMQLLITLFYAILYALKGWRTIAPEYGKIYRTFLRDGFAVAPDFLSPAEHDRVKAEFEKLLPEFQRFDTYTKVPLPHVERLDLSDPRVSDETRVLFREHPMLVAVAQTFLRRRRLLDVKSYLHANLN